MYIKYAQLHKIIFQRMDKVLPCFQKFIHLIFDSKQLSRKVIIRKYSTVDLTPPIQDSNSVSQFQQTLPNNYTSLKDADIFIMPDVDTETSNQQNCSNLLINKCEGGSYVVMRNLQNVYIDTCSNGHVFMGPCHSTVFIRNCQNMTIRVIAQQLRIENSQNIIIQGIIGVKPVLEDCKNIKFYSLSCRIYEDLVWQMQTAKIDMFQNQIYECYDFTPKKTSNFSNGQIYRNQNDAIWEAKIQLNDLDWGMKNTYLPLLTPIKKSMLKKVFTENEVKQNQNIVIFYTKMHIKQLLCALNCNELQKNMTIIKKIGQQSAFKVLKNVKQYRQKILNLDSRTGKWHFLMVKIHENRNKKGLGLGVIEDRELIWKLFDSQTKQT